MSYKYTVLLVDDEQEIREGMANKIPWEQCGFTLLKTAENGLEALELAERLKPDVIITDIRMPFMSGLELINKATQVLPMTKFIVCSGFDDFEYAQQAISLSVFSYVLKPISSNEFINVLVDLKQKMDKEWQEKKDSLTIQRQLEAGESLIYDNFFISCMQGSLANDQIGSFSQLIGVNEHFSYVVFAINIDHSEQFLQTNQTESNKQELLFYAVKNIFDDWLVERYTFNSLLVGQNLVYIIQIEKQQEMYAVLIALNALCKQCTNLSLLYVFGGVSLIKTHLTELANAYQEAKTAVEYSAMLDLKHDFVTYIGDVKDRVEISHLSVEKDNELLTIIKNGTAVEIEQVISDIFNHFEKEQVSLKSYRLYIIDIFNSIIKIATLFKIELEDIFGDSFPNITDILSKYPKNIIESWLIGLSKSINQSIKQKNIKSSKNLVEEALAYIENHYADPELTVEKVSSQLYFSPTYFSTIFKREMSQSFVSYLTDVRLAKALIYLEETNEKNYVIAEKIGYLDPNYFGYVFKKKFGLSPKQYRQQKTEVIG
ncbi:response regulator [Vagococcus zengguangii]|uniref:response regulator n=1 Tax=Vagococcus zengguangii TaxID=2571750 RepID=UPI00110902FD|nr:response regulator [Vagococcus zengguangii]TLG81389.1 response regulator [Vagococcus zengguangii]